MVKEFAGPYDSIVAGAGDEWREIAKQRRASLDEIKGPKLRKLRLRFESRKAERNVKLLEENARAYLKQLEILEDSSVAHEFYDKVTERARTHEMFGVIKTLDHVRGLDVPGLYELLVSDEWKEAPAGARAAFEIAITLALTTEKSGQHNEMVLATGRGAEDWDADRHRLGGTLYEVKRGVTSPDISAVQDVYKLLGMDDQINDIPEIPRFNFGIPGRKTATHKLNDFGLDFAFVYNAPQTQMAAKGKLSYVAGSIDMRITASARPPLTL